MLGSCDFSGDLDCIAKKLYIFVIFQGGGGGPDLLSPPLNLHMAVSMLCPLDVLARMQISIIYCIIFSSLFLHPF